MARTLWGGELDDHSLASLKNERGIVSKKKSTSFI